MLRSSAALSTYFPDSIKLIAITFLIIGREYMESQDEKLAGKSPRPHTRILNKYRYPLETVAEISNEISNEQTERLRASSGTGHKSVPPSPFIVEKYEYDLAAEDDAETSPIHVHTNSTRKNSRPVDLASFKSSLIRMGSSDRQNILDFGDKSVTDHDTDTKLPLTSYRTPAKKDKPESIFTSGTPKDQNLALKSGFFSVRKKTGSKLDQNDLGSVGAPQLSQNGQTAQGSVGTSASNRIKIVNNIFQNTFLQNCIKPTEVAGEIPSKEQLTSKRRSRDLKTEDLIALKSKTGALRRKNNASMEIKDAQRPKKHLGSLLSPQASSTQHRAKFSFHGVTNQSLLTPRKKDLTGEQSMTQKPSDETLRSNTNNILEDLMRPSGLKSFMTGDVGSEFERQQFDQMKKFHTKLSKLIRDVGGQDCQADDIKSQWRFVKDVVTGYVQAKTKIMRLEDILKLK